ncbi:MAG: cation transporter [Caldiserica bacterium]|nr:cation transporter [Caldisericota bacterium]PIW10893.1 MAG: cation transporter [Caldiserica bacterium CG17_big_fil_post_rev_8_21_14_2_50_35_7]
MSFNAWLLMRFSPEKNLLRKRIGYLEAWVSIIGNVLLFLLKLLIGIAINSLSLIADAFHSLSDVLTSIVVLVGFKFGEKPADKEHPFGHGRIEIIATLIIAFLLIVVTYDIGKSAILRIISPQKVKFSSIAIIFMIASAGFKEWMASFSIFLGKKINASSLIADAWHHRSDAIASLLVGLGLIFMRFNLYLIDGILALGVAILIGWIAVRLIIISSSTLIGEAPDSELISKISQISLSVPGVINMHDIYVHDYNTNKIISLHVEVNDNLLADVAHEIATTVEEKIKEKTHAYNVTAHIDPKERKRKD